MNNFLKTFLFFASITIMAQNSGYQTGAASAKLILPLSIETGLGSLDFGDILLTGSGSREIIEPLNGKEFIVRGEAKRGITVNFNDVNLTNQLWISNNKGQEGDLTFIPNVILGNSVKVKTGDNVILTPNGLIGELKFYVGGEIDLKPNQPLGDYEGIFVISVSY